MTVYILLCYYDATTEICGVFDSMAKANSEAKRMEQSNEVEVGNWTIQPEKVK